MTRKITTSILTAVALITLVPGARANIASKAYVDDRDKILIYGTATPSESQLEHFDDYGGSVQRLFDHAVSEANTSYNEAINIGESAVSEGSQEQDGFVTAKSGRIKIASGGIVNDASVSSTAGIQLGKLAFPTPPATCSTRGCMLMFYNNQYIWEPVTREINETVATTGAISATPSTGTTVTEVNARKVIPDD